MGPESGKDGRPQLMVSRTRAELARVLAKLRREGRTLALVPTMGYLHEGHLRLLDEARPRADVTALSIFVNPLQFGPGEDLDRYPRDEARDLRLARERGADLAFVPDRSEMYPSGEPLVQVDPGPLAERLCGRFRPGHFRGVLTVVAKLFGLFRPDTAVFGRKDYQQALLIRRMVRDLELGVEVRTAPLVREEDGLALSSRNEYLSPEERSDALGLYRALSAADRVFREGTDSATELLEVARTTVDKHPGIRLQYLELVDPETLEPLERARRGSVLAVAAHVGSTRLIDNVVLGSAETDPHLGARGGGGKG